jgi:hypothetical protein
MNRISNQEHEKRLNLYNQGLSDGSIAKYCGLIPSSIRSWRNTRNLPCNCPCLVKNRKGGRISKAEEKKRIELYKSGLSDKECAERLNIDYQSFNSWRRYRNLPRNIFLIKCVQCGRVVESKSAIRKRCDECHDIQISIYFTLKKLRGNYAILCITNPKEAEQIKNEIERIEGKEFKEFAINGMYENINLNKIKKAR